MEHHHGGGPVAGTFSSERFCVPVGWMDGGWGVGVVYVNCHPSLTEKVLKIDLLSQTTVAFNGQ